MYQEILVTAVSVYIHGIENIRNLELQVLSSKKQIKRENIDFNVEPSEQQDISELQDQIKQLQMEVDILKEALGLLKKDQGINMMKLKNHEKVVVIDAVEDKYPLHQRLKCLCMVKSSYYYQKSVMKRPDKYAKIRIQIKMIFQKTEIAMDIGVFTVNSRTWVLLFQRKLYDVL